MLVDGRWVPTFPRARYLMGRVEYAHWTSQDERADMEVVLADSVTPIWDSGLVDLVETGATLRANGLVEVERIAEVSARLIVNRPAMKTRPQEIGAWIDRFRAAVGARRLASARTVG